MSANKAHFRMRRRLGKTNRRDARAWALTNRMNEPGAVVYDLAEIFIDRFVTAIREPSKRTLEQYLRGVETLLIGVRVSDMAAAGYGVYDQANRWS